MSAQAAAKAASHAAKTAAQSERGFLNRGAKRDPELYVCASCLLLSYSIEDDSSPPSQFLFCYADLRVDSHGRHVWSLWPRWLLLR